MAIFENIDREIKLKGISPNKVISALGFSSGLYYQWKSGKTKPSNEKISAIANYLDIPVERLLQDNNKPQTIEILNDKVYQVPVFESVSAGMGVYADNKIVGYTSVTVKKSDIDNIIAAKVIGDSMYPYINDGDTVIIKKNCEVNNGDVAVVLLDDEAVVKKVEFKQDSITLISFNPLYPDRVIKDNDCDTVRIIGKVIGSYKTW